MNEPESLTELPTEETGCYLITTESGTIHAIDTVIGRPLWERRPTVDSGSAPYDRKSVAANLVAESWRVGSRGHLVVSDSSYRWGATTHVTATITSITRDSRRCQLCGAEMIDRVCRRASDHVFPERKFQYKDLSLPGEDTVVVAGDWHGNSAWLGIALPALKRETEGLRTILHVGDFGLDSSKRGQDFLASVDFWGARAGIERVLVVPGNHENWDWIDQLFKEEGPDRMAQISEIVSIMPRGYRFKLNGNYFMAFGGAASIDYEQRTVGQDWWLTEIPTEADVAAAIEGGWVDVLLTHETINGGTKAVERTLKFNPMGWSSEALQYSALSRERVTAVWEATRPLIEFHGHMHIADTITLSPDESGRVRRVVSLGRDTQARNLGVLDLNTLKFKFLADIVAASRVRKTRNAEAQYLTRPGETGTGEDVSNPVPE